MEQNLARTREIILSTYMHTQAPAHANIFTIPKLEATLTYNKQELVVEENMAVLFGKRKVLRLDLNESREVVFGEEGGHSSQVVQKEYQILKRLQLLY